jgi:hypothetical protein
MRTPDRRILSLPILALLMLGLPGPSRAQDPEPTPRVFDCGPSLVKPGDLAAVNVGYPARLGNTSPADVRVRILDAAGAPLLERRLRLTPGQSRSVRHQVAASDRALALVRAEFVVADGPPNLRLVGTFQLFGLGLTYGPHLVCSGDTGSRGPA